MRAKCLIYLLTSVIVTLAAMPAGAATNVAVFNFQMTSETPKWVWLEKFLSDQITTDFARSKTLSVVARDEMQLLAQKLNWTPEMATTDPKRMTNIRRQLKIKYLVSGICSVKDDRLEIIAQIVHVKDRKELYRKKVVGKTGDMFTLQKRISADLLSWFTKRPTGQILAELPVWTRSIPAAKALYEGMDLYDQGRYAEGWLKFRQASREDPAYVEAAYWVGKMYYFMDRYLHARRAYDKFVYMDEQHPRLYDAIVEYLHTYERLDTPTETLLKIYDDLGRRFAQKPFPYDVHGWIPGWAWFQNKALSFCFRRRLYKRLYERTAAVGQPDRQWLKPNLNDAVKAHYFRTGEVLNPEYSPGDSSIFREGQDEITFGGKHFYVALKLFRSDMKVWFDKDSGPWDRIFHTLVAPPGQVFKSVAFYPEIAGRRGSASVKVGAQRWLELGGMTVKGGADRIQTEGVRFEKVPRTAILYCEVHSRQKIRRVRCVVEFAKQEPFGMVAVRCINGLIYCQRVEIDGKPVELNWVAGAYGPVPAGKRQIRVFTAFANRQIKGKTLTAPHFDDWKGTVTIKPWQTARLVVELPLKENSPLRTWTFTRWQDRWAIPLTAYYPKPSIQADNQAIRLVWEFGNGLWSSVSTDGQIFSNPRKFPLPLSSAWQERKPKVLRDESGRFLLFFISDRGGQHRMLPYISWSRDFKNWSGPSVIADRSVRQFDVIQDHRGRFIWAGRTGGHWNDHTVSDMVISIWASKDAYHWVQLAEMKSPPETKERILDWRFVRLIERDDGRLEIFVKTWYQAGRGGRSDRFVSRSVSNDGRTWSPLKRITDTCTSFCALHKRGRTVLLTLKNNYPLMSFWEVFLERDDGTWAKADMIPYNLPAMANGIYHPRWGYIFGGAGRLWRGPSLEPFYQCHESETPGKRNVTRRAAKPTIKAARESK